MAETREQFLYLAKLAQSAERYDEMLHYIQSVIEISGGELAVEERELLKIAYNNVAGSRMATRQVLTAAEDKEEESNKALVRDYVGIVETELGEIRGNLIKLFEEGSIPAALESNEFYIQLKELCCSNSPQFKGWTVSLDNLTREQYLCIAKLAKETKRYKDMSLFMEKLLLKATATDGVLTVEELKHLSVPYLHNIRSLRSTRNLLSVTEKKLEEGDQSRAIVGNYRGKIEAELTVISNHILKLVPSAADIEGKSAAEKPKLPQQRQEYGPFLQWFISSNVDKISEIKGLIDSKILLKPWKESENFRDKVYEILLLRGRAELEVCFESSISLLYNALSEIIVVYKNLLHTQAKMKKTRMFLIWRRPLKPLRIKRTSTICYQSITKRRWEKLLRIKRTGMISYKSITERRWKKFLRMERTGMICYKSITERRWKNLQLLVDEIIDWTEQLTMHGTSGLVKGCRCLTITSYSDISAAGRLRNSNIFKGLLGIDSNFKLDKMACMIARAFEAGFSPEKLVFI